MGLVERMARPKAMNSAELYKLIVSTFGGGPTASGISVNSDTAMRLMTVHNCVKVLSQSVAQLPCHLMEQTKDIKNKAMDHGLYRLLHDQPNEWMTATEFWGMAIAHISLRGNFYAYKSGLEGRPIRELIPLSVDAVQEVVQAPDYKLYYRVLVKTSGTSTADGGIVQTTGHEIKTIPGDKIMHLRGLVMNGYMGINPIQYARETIGMELSNERFRARFFGSGLHPGVIVEHQGKLSAQGASNLRSSLSETYGGLGRTHELMLLEEGMKAVFPAMKFVDAQFLELGKFSQSQICGMFRVPLMLVQAGDAPTTYASAEQFMLAFVNHTLTPLVVNVEKGIYRDLLTADEKKRYYAKFNMAGLLRGDMASRFSAYQTAINTEFMCPNEARDLEDLNPYPGGEVFKTRTSTVKKTDDQSKDNQGATR